MPTETILYIILSGIIALLLALFQYWYPKSERKNNYFIYAFLRFLAIFSLLLLLINPKFEQVSYFIDKPSLVILADNTESIRYLDQDANAKKVINDILENNQLNNRFEIDSYVIGNSLETVDSLTFTEKQTNLSSIASDLSQVYKNTTAPILLVSDGNQTYGNDYEYLLSRFEQPIFPVILGDTITYTDLRIQQLNVNRYAYLKNRFPVEVILSYNGTKRINTRFVIKSGNATLYSNPISFSKDNNSQVLNLDLPASREGVLIYSAQILPLEQEKNKVNNTKSFAVEVINQKTNVAIVSDLVHPDLGALKKSIESNEQRKVSFFKSNLDIGILGDYQMVVIYQPNRKFKTIYETLDRLNKNHFTITGTQTDWNFLGNALSSLDKDQTNQKEEYQPSLNSGYNTFMVDDLKFNTFPPLKSSFGDIDFEIPVETILFKKIGNIVTEQAMLATLEIGQRREAFLFGEGIWKWRAQSYLNSRSFNEFDNLISKLIQYLASNKRRNRLSIDYDSFYDGSEPIEIAAQFFDKNYEFDGRGNLDITIRDKNSGESRTLPFILNNNDYRVDLSNLSPGEYTFTVDVSNEGIKQSGSFTILEFNVEQQFLNADVQRLQRVATSTKGKAFLIGNTDSLVPLLINDKRFAAIQKSTKKVVPLIDWKYLLALIALSLAIEWLLRKYNGLI